MGKISSAAPPLPPPLTEMKRKKKKGRPSLTDQTKRRLNQFPKTLTLTPPNHQRRSSRRTSNSPPLQTSDDDDDERMQKKVKLVVRLPKNNHNINNNLRNLNNPSEDEKNSDSGGSGDDLDLGGDEEVEEVMKMEKIDEVESRSGEQGSDQEEKVSKVTDVLHGSELKTGPTTPLPDKKLLVFILDRLQKKDTYGVFSEPVDANELPDYHEIIKKPIDFGTVRKKLDGRAYKNLEELEADILLICSNAMQYNAPDTVYYRQARSIQEIARRDFSNLRHEGDDGEPQPKIVRRGRPPGKTPKKHIERSPLDRIGPEISSDVTLASGGEKGAGPNSSYSLRKTSSLYRHRSSDGFLTPNRSSIGENGSEWSIDWSSEFPASILRADMKHGNKNITVDVTKRDTYREYQPPDSDNNLPGLLNIDGDMKRLMPVGLNFAQHAYARSLAKFAANLGPVAWKVASRKIESLLPAGVKFGPGWVGEPETLPEPLPSSSGEKQKSPSHLASDLHSSAPVSRPSAPGSNPALHQSRPSEQMVEAVRRLNSQSDVPAQSGAPAWGLQGWSHQALQKSMFHPSRNGFGGVSGVYGQSPSQLGMSSPSVATGQSGPQEGSTPYQRPGVVRRNDASSSVYPSSSSYNNHCFEESKVSHSPGKSVYEEFPAEQKPSLPIPPDLNVRVPGPSSPSSTLVAGTSQQQPDLALQL
ncbi:chromatin/chromatin-binding, or -regulatory protein [Lithospermum erythrorhizon]|uniref:Chromatin/chromatin-binding, or -regulatory protein n=1 Tax=Lithospermum erythrorhizon TaxID=34254 RepID=A0AAV3RLX3_LITER